MKNRLILIFLFLFPTFLFSYFKVDDSSGFIFNADIWARSEFDARDFQNSTPWNISVYSKTKLSVERNFLEKFSVLLEGQDSRIFGEDFFSQEKSKTFLKQAYIIFDSLFIDNLDLKIGRFALNISNGRIFSEDNWSLFGKSYDGVKIDYKFKDFSISAFNLYTNFTKNYEEIINPISQTMTYKIDDKTSILGIWNSATINQFLVNFYVFYNQNKNKDDGKNYNLDVLNLGSNVDYSYYDFNIFGEFNYQIGKKSGLNHNAWQYSIDANYNFNGLIIGINQDAFSGQNPTDNNNSNYFFASGEKHKFYGSMGYLSNFEGNSGLGVSDLNVYFKYSKDELQSELRFHSLQSEKKSIIDYTNFGKEIDFIFNYKLKETTKLVLGFSAFLPDDIIKYQYRIKPKVYREDIAYWGYLAFYFNL